MESRNSNIIPINIHLEELTCPITQELFFHPSAAVPCGHTFESNAGRNYLNRECPLCREKIIMFSVPLDKRRMMDEVLTHHPELYAQVYFNLDDFEEVVRKNELATAMGQRFLKLLQHAANHLNAKAQEGTQINKTAIEILVSTDQGRQILQKDEKIKALLTPDSLKLQVAGKTISEWIETPKEESEVKRVSFASDTNFASSSALFSKNTAKPQEPMDTVWQRVVYGNEEGVLEMIRLDPRLVEVKATVSDYSRRIIDNATPFQAALRAGDDVMAVKIMEIYLEANPEEGQKILDAQYNEVFPRGYYVHLREQQRSADDFDRDYLNPLLAAIDNANISDLKAALDKRNDGSVLCRKLAEFKAAFTALSLNEKIYNPYHLLRTFEEYNAKFYAGYGNFLTECRSWCLDLIWRQIIGWEMRYMPTNHAQSICTGLENLLRDSQPLRRTLRLFNHDTETDIDFFPLDLSPSSRMGYDFAVWSCTRLNVWAIGSVLPSTPFEMTNLLSELISTKNNICQNIMNVESWQMHSESHRSRCTVQ